MEDGTPEQGPDLIITATLPYSAMLALRIAAAFVLVAMLAVTTWASLHGALWKMPRVWPIAILFAGCKRITVLMKQKPIF